jgi:hypothetical protein
MHDLRDHVSARKRPGSFSRLSKLAWLLLLALALPACSGQAERVWIDAPGWSRAQAVAVTRVVDPVSMALDDAGNIYLFLIQGESESAGLRVLALDRAVRVTWGRTYDLAIERPDKTRIIWDGRALQLFWISLGGLYTATLDAGTGDMVSQPELLSGGHQVASYDLAVGSRGEMSLWYAGTEDSPGMYALGDTPAPMDPLGIRPDLQYDEAGALHAAWARYPAGQESPEFLYAAYPAGDVVPGREQVVFQPRHAGTARVAGPWMGMDRQYAYVLWTITPRLGPQAGAAATSYVYFPAGRPAEASSIRQLLVPYAYRLDYQFPPPAGGLKTGSRVRLDRESYPMTSYTSAVYLNPAPAPEVALSFRTQLPYLRRQEQGQVGAVFLSGGTPAGYQLLSFTPASSDFPSLLSDEQNQLYLTWLESGAESGYMVYFASTAPDIRKALGGLTGDDVAWLLGDTLFGLLAGAVLVPLAIIWVLASMVVLALTSPLRRTDDSLMHPGVLISLALAVAVYWVSKFAFMPGMSDYVPFSAWLPFLPSGIYLPLRVSVPLLIGAVALWVAWRYTYGRDRPGGFFFLGIYAAVDGLLTMAIYGTVFYAAF